MVVEGSGHDRARVVRRYLSSLDAHRPGRTTARTAESVHFRMHQIDTELLSADPVRRLHLTQERIDLHAEQLRLLSTGADLDELEKAFVRVARGYGDRHEITYAAWRQVGVDAKVLEAAGIKPKAARPQPAKVDATPQVDAVPEPEAEPTLFKAAAKKAPAKKVAVKKAAAAAKKNGTAQRSVKKASAPLPSEAHLLS
jgi:hypothetical protein